MFKKKIIAGAGGLVGLAIAATIVLAATGDSLGTIDPLGPGKCDAGIGVAFDGTTIWYTCAGESKIRKTDLAGTDLGFIDTAEGLTPVSVDAIAWDSDLGVLWGGELVDTGGAAGNDTCRIYTIDPVTGAATTKFDRTDTGCTFSFFDGLTVDNVSDTLYYSPDVQKFILHLDKTGAPLAGSPIDFETLTSGPDVCPVNEPVGSDDPLVDGCPNSGLAIGLDGTLFAGTNGAGKIVSLDPVAESFLGVFTSVTGRDEDLECGPTVDGKETLLSRDFDTGRIDVLEVPEGTCVIDEPPVVECTESVNPHGAKIPPAGKSTPPGTNPNSGVNEDGYYHLGAEDDSGLPVDIFVTNLSGTFTAGPYLSSTTVKITEAPGATPTSKPMGSSNGSAGAVTAHITLDSDALVFGVDAAGNVSDPVTCLVPPPPK
ncbi:hypothetical protein HY008_03800 [Candidatus Woesebacteria bacterium]|nr:hypothetical protein [Candidatus Woesebacteria bacterium]